MKKLVIMLGVVMASVVSQAQLNPGFEAGIGGSADNWTKFGAVNREPWANYAGGQGMAFEWWVGGSGGFYQDIAATAGTTYSLSAWYLDDAAVVTNPYTTKIEWLDGSNLLLGTDSQNVSPLVNNTWQQLSFAGTAPVGAVTARLVFEGAGLTAGQTLKIDEVSFAQVPEPSSLALLGLGLGGLMLRRKK